MTGANRLLIGVAWVVVVIIFWCKTRQPVRIEAERRTELLFLGLATLYAFVVTIKGHLAWYDGVVFLGIYAWYITVAGRRPCVECSTEGPAQLTAEPAYPSPASGDARDVPLRRRRHPRQRQTVLRGPHSNRLRAACQSVSARAMARSGCLGSAGIHRRHHLRAARQGGPGVGSLLSAKLNQWTLLVGMIPGVYAVSHGGLAHSIPMDSFQMHEILLTAAQSLLAVVLLASLRLNIGQALLLFVLFIGQLLTPYLVQLFPHLAIFGLDGARVHELFSLLYLLIALAFFLRSPKRLTRLWQEAGRSLPAHARPRSRNPSGANIRLFPDYIDNLRQLHNYCLLL